jgi:hypothetical protein
MHGSYSHFAAYMDFHFWLFMYPDMENISGTRIMVLSFNKYLNSFFPLKIGSQRPVCQFDYFPCFKSNGDPTSWICLVSIDIDYLVFPMIYLIRFTYRLLKFK